MHSPVFLVTLLIYTSLWRCWRNYCHSLRFAKLVSVSSTESRLFLRLIKAHFLCKWIRTTIALDQSEGISFSSKYLLKRTVMKYFHMFYHLSRYFFMSSCFIVIHSSYRCSCFFYYDWWYFLLQIRLGLSSTHMKSTFMSRNGRK